MTSASPTIRPATVKDAEAISAFNQAMALESENLRLDPEQVARGVRAALSDASKARYYLAELGGRPVGQLMITREWSDWRNAWFWWIQSVYVETDSRGRGVFKTLYEFVRSLAKSRDDTCGLRLYVHNDNTSAIEVYMKLGMDISDYQLCEVDW